MNFNDLLLVLESRAHALRATLFSVQGSKLGEAVFWGAPGLPRRLHLPDALALPIIGARRPLRLWVALPAPLAELPVEQLALAGFPGSSPGFPLALQDGIQLLRWRGAPEAWPPCGRLFDDRRVGVLALACPRHPGYSDRVIAGVKESLEAARSGLNALQAQGRIQVIGAWDLCEPALADRQVWMAKLAREKPAVDLLIYMGHAEHPPGRPSDVLITVPGADGDRIRASQLLAELGEACRAPVRAAYLAACRSYGLSAWEQAMGARASCGVNGEVSGQGITALVEQFIRGLDEDGEFSRACKRSWAGASLTPGAEALKSLTVGLECKDDALPSAHGAARGEYLQAVVDRFGTIGWLDEQRMPHTEAYQEISLESPEEDGQPNKGRGKSPDSLPLSEALKARRRQGGVLVLADPGAGKTTLLGATALQAAEGGEVVPIYVHLARWHRGESSLVPLEETAIRQILGDEPWLGLPPPFRAQLKRMLQRSAREGRALLLVDGVDEVGQVEEYLREVLAFCQPANSAMPVVVASRPSGETAPFQAGLSLGAPFRLAELQTEQIKELARVDLRHLGKEELAHDFCYQLRRNREAWQMGHSPFLLRAMVLLYSANQLRLPTNLGSLYRHLGRRLIQRRAPEIAKALEQYGSPAPPERVERWIEQALVAVAGWMAENWIDGEARGHIPEDALLDLCGDQDMVDIWLPRSGVLTRSGLNHRGEPQWCFLHRTFEEYFGGWWLAQKADGDDVDALIHWINASGIIDPANERCQPPRFELVRWSGAQLPPKAVYKLVCWLLDDDDLLWQGSFLAARTLAVASDDAFKLAWGKVNWRLVELVQDPAAAKNVNWREIPYLGTLAGRGQASALTAYIDDHLELSNPASRVVAALGDSEAVEVLAKRLTSDDDGERYRATKAIGTLGGAEAIEHLIGMLDDECIITRIDAAEALGKLGDDRAWGPLLRAYAGGTFNYTQHVLLNALSRIDRGRANELMRNIIDAGHDLVFDPAGHPTAKHNFLFTLGMAFGRLGDFEYRMERCTSFLSHSDEEIREKAIVALGEIGSDLAVPSLLSHLNTLEDFDCNEFESLIYALGEIGSNEPVEELMELLDHPDAYTNTVVEALGEIGDTRAIAPLLKILSRWPEDRPMEAERVLEALVKIGDPRVTDAIYPLLESNDVTVSWPAAGALARLGDARGADFLYHLVEQGNGHWAKPLGALGDVRAIEHLIRARLDNKWDDPEEIEAILRSFRDDEAITELVDMLYWGEDRILPSVIELLGKSGSPLAIEPLLDFYQAEETFSLQVDTACALARLKEPKANRFLVELTGYSSEGGHQGAASMMKSMGIWHRRKKEPKTS